MGRHVIIDFENHTAQEVVTPDGTLLCHICGGHGTFEDEWGFHQCEECDGEGVTADPRYVEPEPVESPEVINDPTMNERPLL